jgi:hypothetical protein
VGNKKKNFEADLQQQQTKQTNKQTNKQTAEKINFNTGNFLKKQNVNNNKQTNTEFKERKENFGAETQQANKQRTVEENCKAATASSYWVFQLHL